jgi:hypothetical protein
MLALSPNQTAISLGVRPELVENAILQGMLIVRTIPGSKKRRIAVSEIEAWVQTWPKAQSKGPRS